MLKNKDREFWFREEVVCRERIGLKRISTKNFLQLVFAEPNKQKRRLRSVHNYDILTNPIYSDRFLYTPCSYPERHDYVISPYKDSYMKNYSSDVVRLVADLAYMPKSEARKIRFDEKSIFRHMIKHKRDMLNSKNDISIATEGQDGRNINHQKSS